MNGKKTVTALLLHKNGQKKGVKVLMKIRKGGKLLDYYAPFFAWLMAHELY